MPQTLAQSEAEEPGNTAQTHPGYPEVLPGWGDHFTMATGLADSRSNSCLGKGRNASDGNFLCRVYCYCCRRVRCPEPPLNPCCAMLEHDLLKVMRVRHRHIGNKMWFHALLSLQSALHLSCYLGLPTVR